MHPYVEWLVLIFGWEKQVPSLVAALLLYGLVILICYLLYRSNRAFLPESWTGYGQEFVKTMAFVAFPFGHGIMRKYYGEPGYYLCAVPVNTLTAILLPVGEASPVGNWMKLMRGEISNRKFIGKVLLQILAGLTAYRLGIAIFNLDLHDHYRQAVLNFGRGSCKSALKVSIYVGFLAEMSAVCLDCIVRCFQLSKWQTVDIFLKFCVTCFLVVLGFPLTGMCINPVLATGHTFGCEKTHPVQHVLVYWGGPFMGAFLANLIIGGLQASRAKKMD